MLKYKIIILSAIPDEESNDYKLIKEGASQTFTLSFFLKVNDEIIIKGEGYSVMRVIHDIDSDTILLFVQKVKS